MENSSFKDFFVTHKKSIIVLSSIILILIILLAVLFLAYPSKNPFKNIGSSPEKETVQRDEFYSETVENDKPNCTLTKIEYPESAFSIGVPNGWLYEVDNGTISIMEDDRNTTAVFLYTAKLQNDLTSKEFLDAYSEIFRQTTEEGGGTFDIQDIKESKEEASADVTARTGEDNLKGKMIVSKSGEFVTLKAYWAPAEVYEERESLLKQICGCFARTKVLTDDILLATQNEESTTTDEIPTGFEMYEGRYFKFHKPSDFNVTGEKKDMLDLIKTDNRAVFLYAYTTELKGEYTTRSWAEKILSEVKEIKDLTLTDGSVLPSQILGHSIQEFNLNAKMEGIPVLGKLTIGLYQPPYFGVGTKYSSAFWAAQMATTENWEGVKDALQEVQDSFAFVDVNTARRNTLLPTNSPMESTESGIFSRSETYPSAIVDKSSGNWIEGVKGFETVTSPSTGQTYNVPVNSWSSYGPKGPGYYRQLSDNSFEKLQ